MKTILVPTDFSDAAKNATAYAFQLAWVANCKIILFHSYHVPIPISEAPFIASYPDLEIEYIQLLQNEAARLDPKKEIHVECVTSLGFAVDEISMVEQKLKPDLIVMGMRNVGKISEFLLGSITTSFIPKSTVPVLVIPEKAIFKNPLRIAFASDYHIDQSIAALEPLKIFVNTFHAHLVILNLLKERERIGTDKAVSGMLIENFLQDVDHTYHFPEDNDFVHGLDQFISSHQIDMVAIVPHKHNPMEAILHETHTKKMAFHTSVPLLCMPEKK